MTRKQELYLINLGLETLLERVIKPRKYNKTKKMSKKEKKALSVKMKKVWMTRKNKTAHK